MLIPSTFYHMILLVWNTLGLTCMCVCVCVVCRQREERLRRVLEARERGEKAELEKRKKVEQKMAQIIEKDKVQSSRFFMHVIPVLGLPAMECCIVTIFKTQNKDFLKN